MPVKKIARFPTKEFLIKNLHKNIVKNLSILLCNLILTAYRYAGILVYG